MNWYRTLGLWEYSCIGLFAALYILYIIRVLTIAKSLRTSVQPLIAKCLLRTFYFFLLILALLGPSFGNIRKEVKALGKDIYLLVDLSQSMNATDIAPSRLERVKFELNKLIKAFPDDRIGLIVFSEDALVQCPLTIDQSTVLLFTETLKTGLFSGGSTNFESALQLAYEKHTDTINTSLANQAKVIVLFSDGEDYGESLNALLRDIDSQGIRLFTVGVGTQSGGKIPAGRYYKKDKDGQEVVTVLQKQHLLRISEMNIGSYFEISDAENTIPELIQAIKSIEGQLLNTRKIEVAANKYYYFLIAAVLLIAIDVIIVSKTIQL